MQALTAALAELRKKSADIEAAIGVLARLEGLKGAKVRVKLGKKGPHKKSKRVLSEAGRKAIAKAQKARWAMVRKNRKMAIVA